MRALHPFLTTVSPLVILAACAGEKTDSPPPKTDSPASQVDSPPPQLYEDGSRIVSMRLRLRDGSEADVTTIPESTDAVFTSASVLDSILIPYYEGKKDTETVKKLREARASVGNPSAYVAHKLHSRSSVESIK